MKKSTVKTILMISIAYLAIIAVLIIIFSNKIEKLEQGTEKLVLRVVAESNIPAGTKITPELVKLKQVQDVLKEEKLVYRLNKGDTTDESGTILQIAPTDDLWAIGKVTTQAIYAGEYLSNNKLSESQTYYNDDKRLYAVPFDATTTGGFNVYCGEYVDICVLYSETAGHTAYDNGYQNLAPNKMIDVVLSKRMVEDIRDDTGMSVRVNSATQPGYICFRLTYDEINKIELAKKQGSLFIGKMNNYEQEAHQETFMTSNALPTFEQPKTVATQQPVQDSVNTEEDILNSALGN